MADGESVVAQMSAIVDYQSTGYASNDHFVAHSTSSLGGGVYAAGPNGDTTLSVAATDPVHPLPDGSTIGAGNTYNVDADLPKKEASLQSMEFAKTIGVSDASENLVSKETTGHDSTDGNGVSESKTFAVAENGENGSSLNEAGGAVVEQQFEESSVLSSEEDRLWSMVRANCLEFNAWTALIQETEKVAEDNILKIRKVYDAFLAEFPLCYGYWKKFADHEARLGSIDKVVEVYERAVQAVTYSVDIWLHYCIFALSTYGDPDIVRSDISRVAERFGGNALYRYYFSKVQILDSFEATIYSSCFSFLIGFDYIVWSSLHPLPFSFLKGLSISHIVLHELLVSLTLTLLGLSWVHHFTKCCWEDHVQLKAKMASVLCSISRT